MPDSESSSLPPLGSSRSNSSYTTSPEVLNQIFEQENKNNQEGQIYIFSVSPPNEKVNILNRQKAQILAQIQSVKTQTEAVKKAIEKNRTVAGIDISTIIATAASVLTGVVTGWTGLGGIVAGTAAYYVTDMAIDSLLNSGGGILEDLNKVTSYGMQKISLIEKEMHNIEEQTSIEKGRSREIKPLDIGIEPESLENVNAEPKQSAGFTPYSRATTGLSMVAPAASEISIPKPEEQIAEPAKREPISVMREGPVPPPPPKEPSFNQNVSSATNISSQTRAPITPTAIPTREFADSEDSYVDSEMPPSTISGATAAPSIPSTSREPRVTRKPSETPQKETAGVSIKTGVDVGNEGIKTKSTGKIDYDDKKVQQFIQVVAKQTDEQIQKKAEKDFQNEKDLDSKEILINTQVQQEKRNKEIAKKYFEIKDPKVKKDIEKYFALQLESFYMEDAEAKQPEEEGKVESGTEIPTVEPKAQIMPSSDTAQPKEFTEKQKTIPTKTDVGAEPKVESVEKEDGNLEKVRERIKSLAEESDEEITERVGKLYENIPFTPEQKQAEIENYISIEKGFRDSAKQYMKTQDEDLKKYFEESFSDKFKTDQEMEAIAKKPEGLPEAVSEVPTPKEEPSVEKPPTQATASDRKSSEELSAVRNTVVEEKAATKEIAGNQLVLPMPVMTSPSGGGTTQPQYNIIPLLVVNDEEVARMNAFEAGKLRAV